MEEQYGVWRPAGKSVLQRSKPSQGVPYAFVYEQSSKQDTKPGTEGGIRYLEGKNVRTRLIGNDTRGILGHLLDNCLVDSRSSHTVRLLHLFPLISSHNADIYEYWLEWWLVDA